MEITGYPGSIRRTGAGPEDLRITGYHARTREGRDMAADLVVQPVYPGEILTGEFRGPLGIGQCRLAAELGVPP